MHKFAKVIHRCNKGAQIVEQTKRVDKACKGIEANTNFVSEYRNNKLWVSICVPMHYSTNISFKSLQKLPLTNSKSHPSNMAERMPPHILPH